MSISELEKTKRLLGEAREIIKDLCEDPPMEDGDHSYSWAWDEMSCKIQEILVERVNRGRNFLLKTETK